MRIFSLLALSGVLLLSSCDHQQNANTKAAAIVDGHPEYILQGNIYEVNVRQYTPEGTLNAFSNHLDRLKDMGVQTLWFMPITPIGEKDRKGALGSYYAVKDYTAINPEYGTLEDWKSLVAKAHEKGFKVIIDWVANHTSADHAWLTSHPDFYTIDSITKQPIAPFDWTDVRELNYDNPAMQDSMIAAMQFWVKETGIDGFRCDVAGEVPEAFWKKAIDALKKEKSDIFMLAESNDAWLHRAGFNATYPWEEFSTMKRVANGITNAKALDTSIAKLDTGYAKNAIRMYFTSNHDENSWNKADYGTMPGAVHAPFAVLTQTWARSVPLIYSGQEEPVKDSISFFYKNPISFSKFERAPFYTTLHNLRKDHKALAANAAFQKLVTSNDHSIYAFARTADADKVVVVLNLSASPVDFSFDSTTETFEGVDVFTKEKWGIKDKAQFNLPAWGYKVLVKN